MFRMNGVCRNLNLHFPDPKPPGWRSGPMTLSVDHSTQFGAVLLVFFYCPSIKTSKWQQCAAGLQAKNIKKHLFSFFASNVEIVSCKK